MDLFVRTWVVLQTTAWNLGERMRRDERGQTAVEYILVLALVALIVLALTQSTVVSQARTRVAQAVRDLFTAPN